MSAAEHLPERLERDERLLAELVAGATVAAASERSGVSLATAHRRVREPAFRARLDRARRDVMAAVATRLAAAAELGVDVLVEVASDPEAAPSVRVKAALGLLASASAYHERAELSSGLLERLEALERDAAVSGRRPSRLALESGS